MNGARVGSTEIEFIPGDLPKRFSGVVDTGTAGSIPLILQTIIPISIFSEVELDVEVRGGTEVPNSPTIDYLIKLVLPVYRKLGGSIDLDLKRRGYYPRGGGNIALKSKSTSSPRPLELISKESKTSSVNILSVSRLLPEHVARRQVESAKRILQLCNLKTEEIMLDVDGESLSPGSSVLVHEDASTKYIGSTSLGERGKRAELVGEESAKNFIDEISSSPTVDSHIADMLVTLLSCVPGKSTFSTSLLTSHFLTNCEIAKKLVGCEIKQKKSGGSWMVEIVGSPEKPN